MEFEFRNIEEKWKKIWNEKQIYKVTEDASKPKYYVLDMFPYPSGAGLHVGHPLGYVASDIYARYKRLKGFNVLHPMGYDAFGLPAEQYAIETGTHPAITTENAIKRYREQMDKIGFSFDWSREVKTCDPAYYKWTQWIFLQLYNSWYNRETKRAENISTLVSKFESGFLKSEIRNPKSEIVSWNELNDEEKESVLMNYRLVYLSFAEVNWCEALGCVLANDEVKDGKSERGGYPVEKRKMRQWFLRITEYSDRLLEGLEKLDWSEAMKDMQRNWIGRSEGALVKFHLSQTLSEGEGLVAAKLKYHTTDGQTWKHNLELVKENRKNPTEAEVIVWDRIKNKLTGFKFRRQHPIDKYIPDFVCLQKGLVVEIDGKIHLSQIEQDKERTEDLNRLGFQVIRFTNEEVIGNIDGVIEKIKETLTKLSDRKHDEDETAFSGAEVPPSEGFREVIEVFTTRPDTIFGATFMVIAPEHELVSSLTTPEQKDAIEKYLAYVKSRTDIERQAEKKVTGVFTGSYAVNPFTNEKIQIWIAEYVLAGYGTGAIMAVPADDERDKKFAEKFGLPIVDIIDKSMHAGAAIEDKVGKMINSGMLNGMEVREAIKKIIDEIEARGIGKRKVNYKQRDAIYSRQRYWGEPIPVKYKRVGEPDMPFGESNDVPQPVFEPSPLVLPEVSSFKPTGDGRSPLANNKEWTSANYETDTMPGYAGSSWYFLRYMDPKNENAFAAKEKIDYWQNADIYFGGAEHAVGHLLYARMWHKFLFDLGYVNTDEPFKKLVNQGMITGYSPRIFSCVVEGKLYRPSYNKIDFENKKVNLNGDWKEFTSVMQVRIDYSSAEFAGNDLRVYKRTAETKGIKAVLLNESVLENQYFVWDKDEKGEEYISVFHEVEKMSKSKLNTINPDDVIAKYGADCFRMFEMFLGPIEQSKPWDDKGISGVSNFLRKFWRLYTSPNPSEGGESEQSRAAKVPPSEGFREVVVSLEEPTDAEFKILHKTLKKIADDIERLNFNTCVSAFMIATNELTSLGCHKKKILEPLLIALAPFAPFVTEELWEKLGNKGSIHLATYPAVDEKYLQEDSHTYAVSVNGKVRAEIVLPLNVTQDEAKAQVLQLEKVKHYTQGAELKKFIFVKGKIINVVV